MASGADEDIADVNNPTELGLFKAAGTGTFDRSLLELSVLEETLVEDMNATRLRVVVSGQGNTSFPLYNTHSLPRWATILNIEAGSQRGSVHFRRYLHRYLFHRDDRFFSHNPGRTLC